MGLSIESYLLGDFRNISLGSPFALFRKCGFKFVCTLSAYQLEDNAICARVHLGLSNESYFLGDFRKISLGPPFSLFQKMRVLGDLSKIAITWAFGEF